MKQKVLITGSNGFVGQKLMDQILQNRDMELIALSRGENRYPTTHGYAYVNGDVCDAQQMREVVLRYRPDFILHTVAMAQVETCERDVDACARVNIEPVRLFIALAAEVPFQFIHLSTDFVFDGVDGPYREMDVLNPLNEYGKSKAAAERLLQASTINWTIVRTILVYGTPHDSERSNLMLWVKSSLEAGKSIKVVTDHYRMPTLVEDLVQALLVIMERRAIGIYHISGEEGYSIHEIALAVARFWNLDASLIEPVLAQAIASGVPRPSSTGFILEKAKGLLGYQSRSLQEGFVLMQKQLSK